MVTFLTSSFIRFQEPEEYTGGIPLDANGFFDDLRTVWKNGARLLYVASDPDDTEENDFRVRELSDVLCAERLSVKELRIADHRETADADALVKWADVIFLAGGHAPTQLAYLREIGLRDALSRFSGVLIGLSAGSVNAAEEAYLIPELKGESVDPQYVRFSRGLGLTALQIIPHRDYMEHVILDGKRYLEEIVLPDSYGRRFYLIPDGSYFRIQDGITMLCGEGELIADGVRTPLESGALLPSGSAVGADVWAALARDGYDFVFSIHQQTGKCYFYHVGNRAKNVLHSEYYADICESFSQMLVEEERDAFLSQAHLKTVTAEVKERGSYVRTVHIETRSGRRAKIMRVNRIPGDEERLLCSFFDISTAIDHDWMTDEYARTGFLEKARYLLDTLPQDEQVSLIYTNVKGFKAVNELFGDQSGDMVIFQTRDELRRRLKPLLLGRLESDHFVLIVRDELLTDRRLKALGRQTYTSEYKKYNFEIRCGIYHIMDRSIAIAQMIDRAKLAEKSIPDDKGGLFAHFDETVRESYVKQRVLLSDMKGGIENGEFLPFYQPIVDASSGKIVSAEALIRWQHHDLGMVSPGDFIPTFENAGKISALDQFMMKSILQLTEARRTAGEPIVPIAVNLSRIDFYDHHLMDYLREKLIGAEDAPRLVRVEVTESAYADLEKNAMEYLSELKKAGIKILLDDYGSGMSSLSTLESFSFDIVKLDMGFIRKIGLRKNAEAIIDSAIRLSHALGAKVTAEGVETEAQLSFLRDAGCDYIQGYYFYKPLPEAEFIATLDAAGNKG